MRRGILGRDASDPGSPKSVEWRRAFKGKSGGPGEGGRHTIPYASTRTWYGPNSHCNSKCLKLVRIRNDASHPRPEIPPALPNHIPPGQPRQFWSQRPRTSF